MSAASVALAFALVPLLLLRTSDNIRERYFMCTIAIEEAALNFSKAVAASAKPAPCQNTNIVSKVQNVQKSQAAAEHLPKTNFWEERLRRIHEKIAAVRSY